MHETGTASRGRPFLLTFSFCPKASPSISMGVPCTMLRQEIPSLRHDYLCCVFASIPTAGRIESGHLVASSWGSARIHSGHRSAPQFQVYTFHVSCQPLQRHFSSAVAASIISLNAIDCRTYLSSQIPPSGIDWGMYYIHVTDDSMKILLLSRVPLFVLLP
jgi:hypothetical protein